MAPGFRVWQTRYSLFPARVPQLPPPCLVSIPATSNRDMRFPHPALRQPSSCGFSRIYALFRSGRSTPTAFEQPSFQRHSRSSVLSNPSLNLPIVATGAIHNHPVVATSQCCSHSENSVRHPRNNRVEALNYFLRRITQLLSLGNLIHLLRTDFMAFWLGH